MEFSFPRYLTAKKSLDDRSLNRGVWQILHQELSNLGKETPLQVLEIGAGIGTMVERAVDWGLLGNAYYTAVENQPELVAYAEEYLQSWSSKQGYEISRMGKEYLEITHPDGIVCVDFKPVDVFDYIHDWQKQPEKSLKRWDLLIAHAFMDLVPIERALGDLCNTLSEEGIFYFSLNFDGMTIFEPEIDPILDKMIEILYHQTMDERFVDGALTGGSRSGRKLLNQLSSSGAQVLAAGASDWLVYPINGRYPFDEAYFLHHILYFIESELKNHPELDPEQLKNWIHQRKRQVDAGELVYIAHQLDILGRYSRPIIERKYPGLRS